MKNGCSLCGEVLGVNNISEGPLSFCCHGCHAVFNILAVRNQLAGFEQHPLFLQAVRSGLISNPALLEQIQRRHAENTQLAKERLCFEIADMWCPSCAELIRLMLLKERGVLQCVVDYATDLASIEYAPQLVSKEGLAKAILQLGYKPVALNDKESSKVARDLHWRCAIAAFCALNIMMLAYPLYATYFDYDGEGYGALFAWLSFFASLPVLFYSAWPIWRRFAVSLKTGFFGMETLVAIGVGAATGVSVWELFTGGTRVYFDSMSVIIFFVLLGKILESKAKFSAKDALLRLSRATPRRGRKRLADGTLCIVPLKEVAAQECLVAFAGEKIALDGVVSEGEGAADEALMTGEAVPIRKRVGERVIGGSILVQGWVAYTVTHTLEESALSKIIESVEREIGHKSVYVRSADQIVRWFVPLVVVLAFFAGFSAFLFGDQTGLMRALSVLLISCPCAIGIAAPAAESHLLNRLAALGAIVRNRGCLPFLGRESVIVFDKTGTVTEGRYAVLSDLERLPKEEREVLAALTAHSTHPVALALAGALYGEKRAALDKIEEIPGIGLKGVFQGVEYGLGSAKLLSSLDQLASIPIIQDEAAPILSKVYFIKQGRELAEILLGDRIRAEVPGLIAALKPLRMVLLSGDTEATVAAVARQCGFEEWRSAMTPLEKRQFVEQLRQQGEIVCMLGDGINDAPALTVAHTAISVVSATDISIQVSDLLLTSERLDLLQQIRSIARKGQRIVRQNLFWAFFYNVIGIGLALAGMLSPLFAAIAMSLSSLCVLLNAKRI